MPNKKALDYIVEKTKELIGAPTCCDEAKAAAQAWLDAVGTENQAAETERYFAELEEDIMPIENLIAFSDSDAGREYFGAERPQTSPPMQKRFRKTVPNIVTVRHVRQSKPSLKKERKFNF